MTTKSNTLLYVTFRNHSELGRLKVVKDDFKYSEDGCIVCAAHQSNMFGGECCFDEIEDDNYYRESPDWKECGMKSYHFEQCLIEK